MTDLEDVYADDQQPKPEVQTEVIETPEITGEESTTPVQETQQETPAVNWQAKAEEALKQAEEAARKAKGLEQALAATRQKVREQPQVNFAENPAEYVQQVREEMAQQVQLVRIESMQTAARTRYADYDEKETVFAQLAEQNPYLVAQLKQAPNPAEFAYKTAQFHMEMESAGGSIEALKAKIAADLKAERAEKFAKQTANLPKTLSGATGTGRSASAVYSGPTPLSEVYASPKR